MTRGTWGFGACAWLLIAACGVDGAAPCASASCSPAADGGGGSIAAGGSGGEGGEGGAPVVCGDGVTTGTEVCDDGNAVDSDGCNTDCTASGTVLWSTTWDAGAQDRPSGVAELDDGRFVVSASTADTAIVGSLDIAYAFIDAGGELGASETIDGSGAAETASATERGADVARIDGGFVLVGHEFVDNGQVPTAPGVHPWVARFDASGARLWTRTAPSVPRGSAKAVAVADTTIYVGGLQPNAGWLRAFDHDGSTKWELAPDHTGPGCGDCDTVTALTPIAGGVVVGALLAGTEDNDGWLAVINDDSTQRWSVLWDEGAYEYIIDVGVDFDDNVYAFGEVADGTVQVIRKYSPDGDLLWELLNPGGPDLDCLAFAVAPDGGFAMTALRDTGEASVARFDAEGRMGWETTVPAPPNSTKLVLLGVKLTKADRVVVTGVAVDEPTATTDVLVALLSP
jgi:cysteine-rich repeat protein